MRKIFLASTALVAFGTVAANAADVTINGTTDWHYFTYDNDSNTGAVNGSYVDYDADLDFKFTTTTDSGLALTMGVGVSESATDDTYLNIAGDFGAIRLIGDGEGLADTAMDESVADNMSTLSPGLAMHGADLDADTVMYTLPSMNGLVVKAHYQDAGTATKGDSTAFALEYSADVADGSVKVQYIANTIDDTGATGNTGGTDSASLGIRVVMNDFQVTASQHTESDNSNTYDYKNNVIDVKYSGLDDITISAFSLSGDDDLNNTYDYTQSAASLTYTIATGLTASVSMTDTEVTDASGTVTSDDSTALNIKATF
jgi:hypothetical protein